MAGERLSIDKCRLFLGGPRCTLTDVEVEKLRDELYVLANISTDAYLDLREAAKGIEFSRTFYASEAAFLDHLRARGWDLDDEEDDDLTDRWDRDPSDGYE
jgi:hypothetical protein